LGSGRLFKRIPDGCPYFRANHITFHSGICKGVRIVKGNNNGKVQAAVVVDGKINLIFYLKMLIILSKSLRFFDKSNCRENN